MLEKGLLVLETCIPTPPKLEKHYCPDDDDHGINWRHRWFHCSVPDQAYNVIDITPFGMHPINGDRRSKSNVQENSITLFLDHVLTIRLVLLLEGLIKCFTRK